MRKGKKDWREEGERKKAQRWRKETKNGKDREK